MWKVISIKVTKQALFLQIVIEEVFNWTLYKNVDKDAI